MARLLAVTLPTMRLTLLMSLFVGLGCTDTQPCQTFPEVAGVYLVNWGDPVQGRQTDGGFCFVAAPRDPSWTLAQNRSNVTTQISNVSLGGTIYDSFDMVLSGSSGTLSFRMRALTIPEGNSMDAGIRLQGTFTTHDLTDAGELCEVAETFTAQRTSR